MLVPCLLLGVAITGYADISATAADAVTLQDGTVVRGQVVTGAAFQGMTVLVRRDWARANVPSWLGRWERQEAPLILHGRRERKGRLNAWRREREPPAGGGDPVVGWIDREVAKLTSVRPPITLLTAATLNRSEVRLVQRQPAETGRLLRLAWLAGVGNAETMPVADLRDALQFRGRLNDPADPAWVDALLPLYPEPDDRWRTRRAATEVAVEPALRIVRFRELTLPVGAPASPPPQSTTELIDSPTGRDAFAAIQAVTPSDAVVGLLDAIADRGRIGAVVSRTVFAVDSDRAEAESIFMVRQAGDRWTPVFTRKVSVPIEARDEPEANDQEAATVRTALLVLETVASAPSSPETSGRRQRVGSVAGRALRLALTELGNDINPFAFPVAPAAR